MPIGWDHPETARNYEAFCERHGRYRDANAALIAAALLRADHRVLDLGAGTGRTAEAAFAQTHDITCVEPALAMRDAGRARLPQVRWLADWPAPAEVFDRVLCGAAVWQMQPIADTFARVASLLRPGGAFVFNVPSLYLGEPDPPGGGRDPYLYDFAARVAGTRISSVEPIDPLPAREGIEGSLRRAGFEPQCWCARFRLTLPALRDWMKIPPLTDALLDGLSAEERAAHLDDAYTECDAESWRWETWTGWTAWKH